VISHRPNYNIFPLWRDNRLILVKPEGYFAKCTSRRGISQLGPRDLESTNHIRSHPYMNRYSLMTARFNIYDQCGSRPKRYTWSNHNRTFSDPRFWFTENPLSNPGRLLLIQRSLIVVPFQPLHTTAPPPNPWWSHHQRGSTTAPVPQTSTN
jgi:hypothetical protein